jgi:5'-methylthioadenosine phosphorylase
LIDRAPKHLVNLIPSGTYVATNGPRFETPAEIKMYAQVGGDVVGMTGVPEVVLAREMEIHYAAVAHSINWAAGINPKIEVIREGVEETRNSLLQLFVDVLGQPFLHTCECEDSLMISHPPQWSD